MPDETDESQPTPAEILLAEDDDGHATLIRNNLRDVGIVNPVRHFSDGQEVLDFLLELPNREGEADYERGYLLLLDIRMPKVSGDEVLRRMKEDKHLRLIPVIMLTTTDDPREIRHCHELGCSEYVTKPVEYAKFIDVIRRLGLFLQIVRVPPIQE